MSTIRTTAVISGTARMVSFDGEKLTACIRAKCQARPGLFERLDDAAYLGMADVLAESLTSWDLMDAGGQPVRLCTDAIDDLKYSDIEAVFVAIGEASLAADLTEWKPPVGGLLN